MKTASRLLGTAFFLEGFEVQDAPRYGAERRGAPIFAFVRASHQVIKERGIIDHPSLVIVADETLIAMPVAGVLQGIGARTLLLVHSHEPPRVWRDRLNLAGPVVTMAASDENGERLLWRYIGTACAAAAARLVGVVSWTSLAAALKQELGMLPAAKFEENQSLARWAFDLMGTHQGIFSPETSPTTTDLQSPDWINLPFEDARVATPAIHAAMTSERVETGLWRTQRPVIEPSRCRGCWWLCSTYCPDGAIRVDDEGRPQIDYLHCKGCMVCAVQCPNHAITMIPERGVEGTAKHGEGQ
jgi:pyruvate ferredoxin oxidoreductase gamma subunit